MVILCCRPIQTLLSACIVNISHTLIGLINDPLYIPDMVRLPSLTHNNKTMEKSIEIHVYRTVLAMNLFALLNYLKELVFHYSFTYKPY